MADLATPATVQSSFVEKLRATLDAWLVRPGKIVVGLSGGPDSVALMRGLLLACRSDGWCVTAAHLNHRLRGDESERDEQFVRALCAELGVPLEVNACDVGAEAAQAKKGMEETARQARYAFFACVGARLGAAYVALGHTADDQAETVLHRVLRGTGLAGLAGMPARRPLLQQQPHRRSGTPHDQGCPGLRTEYSVPNAQHTACNVELIRPLLAFSRDDVLAFLGELNQRFVHDETNEQLYATRNRLRQDLLPKLADEYNPKVRESLVRLGRLASETQEVVTALAEQTLEAAIVRCGPNRCELDTRTLAGKHRHLIRACLVRLWQRQGWPLQAMSYEHWDRLAELVVCDSTEAQEMTRSANYLAGGTQHSVPGSPPVALSLPGCMEVRRRGNVLALAKEVR